MHNEVGTGDSENGGILNLEFLSSGCRQKLRSNLHTTDPAVSAPGRPYEYRTGRSRDGGNGDRKLNQIA